LPDFTDRLGHLSQPENLDSLRGIARGVEKESLRVTGRGQLARTPHSPLLGSALTHPAITTDYSEALLEFITPPTSSVAEVLATLEDIHRFTYRQIDEELLWVHSMPCVLIGDDNIPVARYGSSNIGRMKTIYRLGLGHRYGRSMQTIAGIHYNWSLPDVSWQLLQVIEDSSVNLQEFKSRRYFDLIRNFRRYFWLLIYLFGAAPAVCRSFVAGRPHRLVPFGKDVNSLHTPYATSLRMGDLGYQSLAQRSLLISYNNLSGYLQSLQQALTLKYPKYDSLGTRDAHGNYLQLSTSLLQVENEFYSSIRPKRTTRTGETQFKALAVRGVEYIEVRCIDLNPFQPVGIDARQMQFLDIFLLYCLLADSPESDTHEYHNILENQTDIVYRGRDPQLQLRGRQGAATVATWGKSLFADMQPVAELLDRANGNQVYGQTLKQLQPLLQHPERTPSARILAEMAENNLSYFQLALNHAREHRDYFLGSPLNPEVEARFREMARTSLVVQQALEAGDSLDFESFLGNYFQQYQLRIGE